MKLSSMACASIVALAASALTAESILADAASGAVTHRRQHGLITVDQKTGLTCPPGQIVSTSPTTGKQSCAPTDMAVKGTGTPKNSTTTAPAIHKTWDSSSPK